MNLIKLRRILDQLQQSDKPDYPEILPQSGEHSGRRTPIRRPIKQRIRDKGQIKHEQESRGQIDPEVKRAHIILDSDPVQKDFEDKSDEDNTGENVEDHIAVSVREKHAEIV